MDIESKETNRRERKFSQEQYDMLKRCSEKKDMTEWNSWRKKNPDEDILLEGAELKGAYLEGAELKGAYLEGAELENAVLWEAKLQRANLRETYLQKAKLMRANIQGSEFGRARVQGADFSRAIVDGETLIWDCEFDSKTKFEGVALGNMRIYPREKQLFEYNIRRMNWEEWYRQGAWWVRALKNLFVRPFWWVSDYGRSTWRIILSFSVLAVVFGGTYYVWGLADPPGIVSNLFELEGTRKGVFTYELIDMTRIERQPGEPITVRKGTALARAIYFSVVTQTTLGFGDMYANAQKVWGHVLLSVQVILGYVLLGALVTRFAVLFTAGGPAGKFSNEEDK